MYAKIEDGVIIYAPKFICIDEQNIWNASSEQYASLGWLPVVYTDVPQTDENHYTEMSWVEQDGQIVQQWTVYEIPVPSDDDELTADQIVDVLMGETL